MPWIDENNITDPESGLLTQQCQQFDTALLNLKCCDIERDQYYETYLNYQAN